jgi:hypothetical protein
MGPRQVVKRKIPSRCRKSNPVIQPIAQRNSYKILVGKSERKRPLEGLRRRWEDNIKMDIIEMCYRIDSSDSGWSLLASSCEFGH